MKYPGSIRPLLFALASLAICLAPLPAQEQIDITHPGGSKRIPISLEGYTGEVLNVLTFDLEIQGFEVTGADKAQYFVSGSNNIDVTGRLADRVSESNILCVADNDRTLP